MKFLEALERCADPVEPEVWNQLGGGEGLSPEFVDFMQQWGGCAIFEEWIEINGLGFTRFLGGGSGANTVEFEWGLLDENLRHYLPFASNDYGGQFFLHSVDGSVWYANVQTAQEDGAGGQIAVSFPAFLELLETSVGSE